MNADERQNLLSRINGLRTALREIAASGCEGDDPETLCCERAKLSGSLFDVDEYCWPCRAAHFLRLDDAEDTSRWPIRK